MKRRMSKIEQESPRLDVPQDVAVLYAWANLPEAKYRDFSTARREGRARVRQREAQADREPEAAAAETPGGTDVEAPAATDDMRPERFPRRRAAHMLSASSHDVVISPAMWIRGKNATVPEPAFLPGGSGQPSPKLAYAPDSSERVTAIDHYDWSEKDRIVDAVPAWIHGE